MCGKHGSYIEFPGGKPYRPGIDGPAEINGAETHELTTEIPNHSSPVDGHYDRVCQGVTAGPRDISSPGGGGPDAI